MDNFRTKSYLNTKTGTVHIVSNFPQPKGNGFVQCGHFAFSGLTEIACSVAFDCIVHGNFKICKRCQQLVGGGA